MRRRARSVRRRLRTGRARAASSWFAAAALGLVAACTGGESGVDARQAALNDTVPDLRQPHIFQDTAPETFRARFETTEGDFTVEVHRDWSPRGADRFYNLVKAGYYDGVTFHRVVDDFVVEFGIHGDPWVNAAWRQLPLKDEPVLESNTRGRVSYAKGEPNSRTTIVFVNLKDNSTLDDDGFAPFGEVVEGMEVIESLYSGYGDGPPRGEGVYKSMAIARGDDYLDEEFPELDRIERAVIVEGAAGGGSDDDGRG